MSAKQSKKPQTRGKTAQDSRCMFYFPSGERCLNHRSAGSKNPAMCFQHQNEKVAPPPSAGADRQVDPPKSATVSRDVPDDVPSARFMSDVLSPPSGDSANSFTALVPTNELGPLLDSIQDDMGVSDKDMQNVTIRQSDPRFVFVAVPKESVPLSFEPADGAFRENIERVSRSMSGFPERRVIPESARGYISDGELEWSDDEYDRPSGASWADMFRRPSDGGGSLESDIDPESVNSGNAVLAAMSIAKSSGDNVVMVEEDGRYRAVLSPSEPFSEVRCQAATASGSQCMNIVVGGGICFVHRGEIDLPFYREAAMAMSVQQGGLWEDEDRRNGDPGSDNTTVIPATTSSQNAYPTAAEFEAITADAQDIMDSMGRGETGRPLTEYEQSAHEAELHRRGERQVNEEAARDVYAAVSEEEQGDFDDLFDDEGPESETGPRFDPGDDPNDPMTKRRRSMEEYAKQSGATAEFINGEEPVWNIDGMLYSRDGVYLGDKREGDSVYQNTMIRALRASLDSRQGELRDQMDFSAIDSVSDDALPATFSPHGPFSANVPDDTPDDELSRRRRAGERFVSINDRDGNPVVVLSNGDIFNTDGSLRLRSGASVPEIGTVPTRPTPEGQWSSSWAPDPASRDALNAGRRSAKASAAAAHLLAVQRPAMNKLGARSVSRRTAARQIDARCRKDPEFARDWSQMDVSQQAAYLSSMEDWYVHRYNVETRMKQIDNQRGGRSRLRQEGGLFGGIIDFMSSLPEIFGRSGSEAAGNATNKMATGR